MSLTGDEHAKHALSLEIAANQVWSKGVSRFHFGHLTKRHIGRSWKICEDTEEVFKNESFHTTMCTVIKNILVRKSHFSTKPILVI